MATAKGATARVKGQVADSVNNISCALKRKVSSPDTKELLQNAKTKSMKTENISLKKETETSSKLESDYKETILYDEYLESGIPDKLLEGLGLNADCDVDRNADEEDDEEEESAPGISQNNANTHVVGAKLALPAHSQVPLLPSSIATSSFRKSNRQTGVLNISTIPPVVKLDEQLVAQKTSSTSCSNTGHPTNQSTRKRAPRNRNKQPVPESDELQSPVDLSCKASSKSIPKTVVLPHYAITKGKVMYEYTPTGTVIASIIRNEAKDNKTSRRSASSGRVTPTEATPLPPDYLDDCPINAENIEEVLDDLHQEAESMRRKLSSMKDDLRRLGVSSAITDTTKHTKEQVEKAAEVSRRVKKIYAAHIQVLERIEKSRDVNRYETNKEDCS